MPSLTAAFYLCQTSIFALSHTPYLEVSLSLYTLSVCSCTQKLLHSCNIFSAWYSFHTCSLAIWMSPNNKNCKHFLMRNALNFLIIIYITYKNIFPRLSAYGIYLSFMLANIPHFWETHFVWSLLSVCPSICKEPPPHLAFYSVLHSPSIKKLDILALWLF